MDILINTEGFNAVLKGRYGYLVFNKNDLYVGRAIQKYGEFSESEVSLFRQLCKAGDIVVEVGANIGAHTLALSQIVGKKGRVYAFEPQRIVFQTLCANMAINSIENVECHQYGVSSEGGFLLIPDIRYDLEGNFGGVEIEQFNDGYEVSIVKLDDFLTLPKLNFLKIDVEGMEYKVITGAKELIAKHKPILYVENDRVDRSKELIELIKSLNYRLFWHRPLLYNPNNYAEDHENIYPGIASYNMLCFPSTVRLNIQGFQEILDSEYHPLKK